MLDSVYPQPQDRSNVAVTDGIQLTGEIVLTTVKLTTVPNLLIIWATHIKLSIKWLRSHRYGSSQYCPWVGGPAPAEYSSRLGNCT